MKTRILFFTMIAAALTFSCQKAELENNDVVDNGTNNEVVDFVPGPGKILAVSPTGTETKIAFGEAVDGKYPVVWTNNDAIKVYSESNTEGVVYTYTTEATEGVSSAVFTGDPVEGETRYAVFPATRAGEMEDGKIKVDFGALYDKQNFHSTLKNNGNNLKYMPMWAKESDRGVFQFNNLCAAVMFRFNDYQELRGMKIVSVKITSANNYISGCGTVDPETGVLTLSGTEDAQKTIVVGHDKTLGPLDIANKNNNPSINDEGVAGFVTALPAMTYPANDLTVTITDNFGRVFERVVTTELVLAPGQAREFPTLPFTLCYGTANCITVELNQTVTFDITPYYSFSKSLAADSMQPVKNAQGENFCEGETTLERLWGIRYDYDALTVNSVLPTANISKENNTVTITAGDKNVGNALLVLKDKEGTILWSWHIWVVDGLTDQKYTNCTEQGSPTFMDRNLGAYSNEYANRRSIGLYYQYGRKDPFVINTKKDFTYAKSSPYFTSGVELTRTELRSANNARVSWTIKHPDTRIIHTNAPTGTPPKGFNDWLVPGTDIVNHWGNPVPVSTQDEANASKGGYKTIYDPCPAGYRVPDYHYLSGLTNDNRVEGAANEGCKFNIDGTENYAVYPLPGTLSVGKSDDATGLFYYNYRGYYWTTTLTSTAAVMFLYNSTNVYTNTFTNMVGVRPAAANIRCMKIQ